MHRGRIKHHLVNNINRSECTVLFVGYQARGTLGREIVEGKKRVRILGRKYRVRARIETINGFSAHADRDELLRWIRGFRKPPERIFLVHGEENAVSAFGREVRRHVESEVIIPEYRDEYSI